MPTINIPRRIVVETFGRLRGVRALITALDTGVPEAWWKEQQSLQASSAAEGWDQGEYDVELQVADEKFRFWARRFATYAAVILLHSVVETQLFASADQLRRRSGTSLFRGKRRGLDRARQQLKVLSGLDVRADPAWRALLDLEGLRNVIVHAGGALTAEEDERWLARLVARHQRTLWLSERSPAYESHVVVSLRFSTQLLEVVDAFFRLILPALGFSVKGARWIR
jgi:hypothetical protein